MDSNTETRTLAVIQKQKEHIQQQINTFKFVWWGWVLSFILCMALTSGLKLIQNPEYKFISTHGIVVLFLGGMFGVFLYVYVFGSLRQLLSRRLRQIELELIKFGAEELQERLDEGFFTKLVQINFKYLDQYYLQTQEQADKSFRLASGAAIAGFVILLLGILMMYYDSSHVQVSYITTSAGVISEFISAVFFYLYNRTILKMSQYHKKLVITQNISLALKITDDMDKNAKGKSLELLVDRLTLDVNKYLSSSSDSNNGCGHQRKNEKKV